MVKKSDGTIFVGNGCYEDELILNGEFLVKGIVVKTLRELYDKYIVGDFYKKCSPLDTYKGTGKDDYILNSGVLDVLKNYFISK